MQPEQLKIKIVLMDDSIIIKTFVVNDHHNVVQPPTQANIEREISRGGYAYKSWTIINDDDIPADRTYRNAWNDAGGKKIGHDMAKAREIHRDILRRQRAPLLEVLDIEMQRAYKDSKKQDEIEAKKQKLRDVTDDPAIEVAQTVEDLKKIVIKE